jgi:hypothetical protein
MPGTPSQPAGPQNDTQQPRPVVRRHWLARARQGLAAARSRFARRAHARTPRQRRRTRRILVTVVVLLLAYPVLGTLALWTGLVERLLASEDLRVELDNPAYTIWPGRIRMKRVKIMVNGDTQFTLEGHDLVVNARIFPLIKRKLHVTELEADGVIYRMRVQVDSDKGIEERLAAYPPLTELPGAKVIREDKAAKTEERGAPWTVQVDGLDISVGELWFMEYRYIGDGTLRGGFLVGPSRMQVSTAVQDLGPGQLRFGEKQVIAEKFGGRISANIPEVNPEAHADTSFLEFVTSRITLKGDIASLKHVSAYLDGISVADGKGHFRTDLRLEKGRLGKESHIDYATDAIRVAGKGFGVKTDWKIEANVAGPEQTGVARQGNGSGTVAQVRGAKPAAKTAGGQAKVDISEADPRRSEKKGEDEGEAVLPRVRSESKVTYVSLVRPDDDSGREFTIQIQGHEEQAVLRSTQLGGNMDVKTAHVRMPKIVTSDFDDLGAVLGSDAPVKAQRGSARASVILNMNEHKVMTGPVTFDLDDALFQVAGVQLGGEAAARARVRVDLKREHTQLDNFTFHLRDVLMHVGDEHVEKWWVNVSSPRLEAWQKPGLRYQGSIAILAKDAEPILEALAEKDKLNDLIAKFTSLDDLRASVAVRGAKDETDVMIRSVESDVWDIAGRVYSKGKTTRAALVVGGKAVSLGIATDGKNTEIKPFAGADWLNAHLRTFPKPKEQVAPPKP